MKTVIEINNVTMAFNKSAVQYNGLKEYVIKLMKGTLFYQEHIALSGVSLSIEEGDVFGIVGLNGSGKSTILKIIAGILKPTKGTAKITGSIAPLIELGAGFDAELTGRENIFLNGAILGYSEDFITKHFDAIVDFAEMREFIDAPMKTYSSGMYARVAFAVATIIEPDILIADEVLAVGDFRFREKCEARISSLIGGKTTVLLVSHSIEQVRKLCKHVMWLEHGKVRMIGPVDEVCDAYTNGS